MLQNKTIAVVGGGPGGLTLATQQGTTLDLHEESGLAALQKAGLVDQRNKDRKLTNNV